MAVNKQGIDMPKIVEDKCKEFDKLIVFLENCQIKIREAINYLDIVNVDPYNLEICNLVEIRAKLEDNFSNNCDSIVSIVRQKQDLYKRTLTK